MKIAISIETNPNKNKFGSFIKAFITKNKFIIIANLKGTLYDKFFKAFTSS